MPVCQIFKDFCGSALKNATEACATGESYDDFLPWGTNFLPFPRMTLHIVKYDGGVEALIRAQWGRLEGAGNIFP